MNLRKYQEDGLVSIRDFFNSSLKTGIYVSPVGTGKSILIAESAKMRKNVLVLQPSSELLKQNYEKYSYYGFPASIYSASLKSRQVGDVTFATIGSVMGEKDRFKGVDTIIVDEVHRGSKKDNLLSELVSYLKVEKVLGFTATPIMAQNTKDESYLRMMDSYRECIFDNIIHITQIQEILPFWTPIEYKFSKTQANSSMLKLNSTGNDYTVESLKRFYDSNSIEFKILKSVEWLKSQGVNQSLIFVPTVEEAQSLANQIKGAELMCGDKKLVPDKERLRIVEGFKSGEIKYVVNVDVLGTGFDYPALPSVIHGRPTGSFVTFYQHIGRGVRQSNGKDKFWFLDLVGNVNKFGRIEEMRFEQEKGKWDLWVKDRKLTHRGYVSKVSSEQLSQLEDSIRYYSLSFGKYKGRKLSEIVKIDKKYLMWLSSDDFQPSTDNAILDKRASEIILKQLNLI